MPAFAFQARTSTGRPQAGREQADSAAALVNTLKARGWMVLSVTPVDQSPLPQMSLFRLPIRASDIEFGLQQIAVMLKSGLTLLTALRTAAEQSGRSRMAAVWNGIAEAIQAGSNLGEAMGKYRYFPRIVLQLVKVGEQTGTLDTVLVRGAEAMERKRLLRMQLFTALFYPAIVLVAAVGVAGFMVFYLIPKLQKFLTALGRKLPPLTQYLLDVADFFQVHGVSILAGVLVLLFTGIALYLWPTGRLFFDRWALRAPVVGSLFRLSATAQFAHAMGVLLRSGVTLVEGLRTVEDLFRNRYLAGIVHRARESILAGGGLGETLLESKGFLPMLGRMASVGEASGALDDLLEEVARFHENQLQAAIRRFSVIIEPVIICVVGGVVGFVYIAFFMALFAVAGGK